MRLIQVVTALPPAVDGVGDYATLLARELWSRYGVGSAFLAGNPGRRAWELDAPFTVETVEERSAAALLRRLERTVAGRDDAVLLHYVGYGYATRGCPFWLVEAVEKWKSAHPDIRLVVLFHELFGSGPVWTSGFWTSPFQKRLARRLARAADFLRTTTELNTRLLRAMLPPSRHGLVAARPVFSNVGEPAAPAPYGERRRQIVVFGGGGTRRAAYTRHRSDLLESCDRLRIERIIDVGVPLGDRPDLPVPCVEKGVLPAQEISRLLSESSAGFLAYPLAYMAKSGVFAAYCAHGVTTVSHAANVGVADEGLRAGEHFLAGAALLDGGEETPARVASAGLAWYQQHRREVHAREIHQALGKPGH